LLGLGLLFLAVLDTKAVRKSTGPEGPALKRTAKCFLYVIVT
jgi:hypothetical protein